jgi:glycine oxidase
VTSSAPDTIIVGGGIAGLAAALALGDAGHRVAVLDDSRPGAASRASAGMLAPSLGFPAEILGYALAARDLYPSFLARLTDASGIDIPLDRRGILEVATSEAESIAMQTRRPETLPGTWFDAEELARLEPWLCCHAGAILHPLDGAVEVTPLMDALAIAVARHPRIRVVPAAVIALAFPRDGVVITMSNGSRLTGARVVVATGAWAGAMGGLPRSLPVRPVKGELLLLEGPRPGHIVYSAGGYLIPRRDGILVGATSEEAAFEAAPTAPGRATLIFHAGRIARFPANVAVLAHWAGLRPVSPDGLPIAGPDPDQPALVYFCGLSRNGILFGPWIAQQLAADMSGRRVGALRAFGIQRFSLASTWT